MFSSNHNTGVDVSSAIKCNDGIKGNNSTIVSEIIVPVIRFEVLKKI
jgi:hypothetical protein